tara:strand:+ start:351 stop:1142 length:792 start_codon:yes stop_codon:yes gene_type:complete
MTKKNPQAKKSNPTLRNPPKFSNWNPSPKFKSLLGQDKEDISTGICVLLGSARSGKSTQMLALVEWCAYNTNRKFAFVGLPNSYLEALPKFIRDRSSNPKISELTSLRDCIVILDDTAATLSSKDSITNQGKFISRIAGVISHLGLTLILTVQSMAGLDLSLMRFTEMAVSIKRVDPMALRMERSEWSQEVKEGQIELSFYDFDRSLYFDLSSGMVCKHPFKEWFAQDILSRPFRYLDQTELNNIIDGVNTKTKPKRSKHEKK